MVEEAANDYAKYLTGINFHKEIEPVRTNIDELLTRMEEFESSLIIMKNLSTLTSLPEIIQCGEDFQMQFDKIDKLQLVLNVINQDLTVLENSVSTAEEKLGYNNSGLKGFLKPWFGMSSKNDKTKNEGACNVVPTFTPTTLFKASDYFVGQQLEDDCTES